MSRELRDLLAERLRDEPDVLARALDALDWQDCSCEDNPGGWCWYRLSTDEQVDHLVRIARGEES